MRSPRGQVVDRIQGPVVDAPAQLVASGEHEPGELLVRFRAQGRDHEVAAQEADRVLHAALLMTCVRVAEAHVEPVMRDERLEHAGERDLAFGIPMPGAGRVVDHQRVRHAADMPEHGHEPLADAFRVLRGQRDGVPFVRMGERDDQAMVVDPFAGQAGTRQTEIHLHGTRRPPQFHVPVAGLPVPLSPLAHVAQHRGVRAREPPLVDQPVIHAFGGMPLLARHEPIRLQPLVDQRLESVQHRGNLAAPGLFG